MRVTHVEEECSNLGGVHVAFELVDAQNGGRVAHFGGHGCWLRGFATGGWYVAGLDLVSPARLPHDPGGCLGALPAYDAKVVAIIAVGNRESGETLLASLR